MEKFVMLAGQYAILLGEHIAYLYAAPDMVHSNQNTVLDGSLVLFSVTSLIQFLSLSFLYIYSISRFQILWISGQEVKYQV